MARDTMGFDFGLESDTVCFKRKNRWLFSIEKVMGDQSSPQDKVNALPPYKGARPSISFKELEAQHINETIYFPGKPEWKPVTISLYDIKKPLHPVFEWLKGIYDPLGETYVPSCDGFKKEARLELFDGCGEIIETWIFENAWPQNIEFGELDMSGSELVTCDLTIRYDRAYILPA